MALVVYTGENSIGVGTDDINVSSSTTAFHSEDKFVGLANQGATCYLNGLIQTLFMTPDFRKAVFTWQYDPVKDGSEELCIPLQLQKLFGQLHMKKLRVVDTVALTKSFGWEGFEVFQQQDVQELTRVLFDALEESFRGTSVENVIDELYAGELIDYLRCIDVDYQSERIDKFLDFSLAIVPFGSTVPMKTLTECIEMFLRPEILDGENKYYAEKYDRKVDAIKGLKFGKLPQIMSVQLKRFVYDFSGDYVMQKKLNDQVKFPMILDMNKYLAKRKVRKQVAEESNATTSASSCGSVSAAAGSDGETVNNADEFEEIPNEEFEKFLQEQMSKLKHENLKQEQQNSNPFATDGDYWASYGIDDDPSVPPLVSIDGEVVHPAESTSTVATIANEEDQVVYESLSDEQIQNLVATKGEWVYELYAVLIHSGAISGGHYYAYIKELSTKKWYNFNDSSVTSITEEDVKEAWGGTMKSTLPSYYYPAKSYQSSANAYMLMYRKVQRELPVINEESIPTYILNMVKEQEEKILQKQREEEELRNKVSVHILWENKEYVIPSHRKMTYHDLLTDIWYRLELATVLKASSQNVASSSSSANANPDGDTASSSSTAATLPTVLYDRFRLRDYNIYSKIATDVYVYGEKSHETLEDLFINDYKVYQLETREEHEEWEVYSKYDLSFAIEEYDEESDSFLPTRTLRVPDYSTIGELKDALIQKKIITKYPREEIRVMKITNAGTCDAKGESFDDDSRRLRTDLFFYDSMKVYVERRPVTVKMVSTGNDNDNDNREGGEGGIVSSTTPSVTNYSYSSIKYSFEGTPMTEEDSKSLRLFVTQRNRINIRVSYPTVMDEKGLTEHDFHLSANGRWKVQELRERIVQELQSPSLVIASSVTSVDHCRLFKTNTRGIELKDNDVTLGCAGLYDGITICVVKGDLTPPGMFQIQVKEFFAKDIIVGVMQLPSFAPPLPPPLDIPSSPSSSYPALYVEKPVHDIESIIDYDTSKGVGVGVGTSTDGPNIEEIEDEDKYYETLTAARYKRAAAYSSINNQDNIDTDTEDGNCSNQGNCDLSPDDFLDAIDESPVTSTSTPAMATASFASATSYSNVPHAQATAVAEVMDESPPSSYAAAVSGYHAGGNKRSLDMNDIASLNAVQTESSFFKDEQAFPALQHPTGPESDVAIVDNGSGVLTDSAGLTPLSDSNIATETANHLLEEIDINGPPPAPSVATNVIPSDFGERVVNNSTTIDQIIEIPGMNAMKLYAKQTMMVEELRDIVLNALIQCQRLPEGTSPYRIRLRERFSTTIGKFLRNGKTLQQSNFYLTDNKALAVQILQDDEILPLEEVGDVIVNVQKFHRSTWTLSEKIEVLFPGSMSIQDISKGLCMLFDIPFESMEVLIIPRETTLHLHDLSQRAPSSNYGRAWFDPTKETKLMRYMSHDFRLLDGDLLMLQNTQEPLGELSEADKLSVNIVQTALNDKTNNSYSWTSSNVTWSDTYAVKYPKTGGVSNGGGGIRIKTHKDRLKEQNNNNGTGTADSVGSSELTSPLPALEPVNDMDGSTNSAKAHDDREFNKQGGYALFSDLL